METEYWIALWAIILLIILHPKLRRTAKFYGKYFLFFAHLGIVCTLGIPLCFKHPVNCKSMWIFARLITLASGPLGLKWEIRHREKMISNDKSAIIIANHQCMYDVVGMLQIWKRCSLRCGTIARDFFFWLWPFGLAMWLGGTIFIKRQSGLEATKKCFNEAAQQLFRKNEKLWVYVEGTRNSRPETLLPFKKGAFITAINNQVPLQPIIFTPYYFLDFKRKIFDSGKVIIEIMDPIPTEGLTRDDLDDLVAKTHAVMSEKHKQLLNELRPLMDEYKKSIKK